jgi:hypothetical protein
MKHVANVFNYAKATVRWAVVGVVKFVPFKKSN